MPVFEFVSYFLVMAEGFYKEAIAPLTLDLPNIMTMATPDERKILVKRFEERLESGKFMWTGAKTKNKPLGARQSLQMTTQKARDMVASGHRGARYHASGNKGANVVTFSTLHVAMLAADKYPTEESNYTSHLCHWSLCLDHTHVIWESATRNLRRERLCRRNKICICALEPPCDFTLH